MRKIYLNIPKNLTLIYHPLYNLKKLLLLTFLVIFSLVSKVNHAQNLSKSDTAKVHFLNSRKFYIYKVNKGETLFGISQKFNIPQEEIIHFNREIEKTGLKAKKKIWIPAYSWIKKETNVDKEIVEYKTEKFIYSVAVVTCFNLPKIYTTVDTSGTYIEEPLKKEIKENLEFVEGVLHSAEVLRAEGIKVHIYIIDSENDSLKLLNKLNKNIRYDHIITNENGNTLKYISHFSVTRNIKLFSTGINTNDIIKENGNAFSMNPSSGKQCEQMGKFSGKYFPNSSLITLKTSTAKENERAELFRLGWMKNQDSPGYQIDYIKSGAIGLVDLLDKKKTNVIFISSSNEDLVSSILIALNRKISEYKVRVIGLPTWQYFETIDQKLIENCNVYLFSSGFIDYSIGSVLSFRKHFRDKYNIEPSEISYQGYDAFLVAGKFYLKYGNKIYNDEKSFTIKGIFSEYTFVRSQNERLNENINIHVFQPANDVTIDIAKNFNMK